MLCSPVIDYEIEEDNLIYKFVCAGYLAFFAAMFMTNEFFLPHKIFLYFIAPLLFLPVYLKIDKNVAGLRYVICRFSWVNPFRTLIVFNSVIFLCAAIFVIIVSVSSWLYPSPALSWFLSIFSYLLLILLFLACTNRVMGRDKSSMQFICSILTIIVTVNAIINLYFYAYSLPNALSILDIRFAATFGRAPDHYPTTCALTYAVFFTASACLATMQNNFILRSIFLGCSFILLIGIILTQSRGPLFASLISIFVGNYLYSINYRKIIARLTAFVAVAFLLIPKIGKSAIQRGDNFRLEVWNKFWILMQDRFLMGYGERIEFKIFLSNGESVGHAHNLIFSALVRGGFLAAISLFGVFALIMKYNFLYAKLYHNHLPLCLALTIGIAGLVDFDLIVFLADWQWVSFWFIFGISINAEIASDKWIVENNIKF